MSSPFANGFPLSLLGQRRAHLAHANRDSVVVSSDRTDETLIEDVCSGKKEALAALFERYAKLTKSIAVRILHDRVEAEDLVQDLFLYLQRKCTIFDSSKSSARSWIIQMTYHRAIERRRYLTTRHFYSRSGEEAVNTSVVGVPTDESDYSAEAVFGRNGLNEVFESMSEGQRETLRLYFFDGYTLAEIAEKLSQPYANVRHHYYRGLEKLRKQMFRTSVPVAEPHGK